MLKDKKIGQRVRTHYFQTKREPSVWKVCSAQVGIYSSQGQKYTPQDADQVAYYREDTKGQVLQEGSQRTRCNGFLGSGWNQLLHE